MSCSSLVEQRGVLADLQELIAALDKRVPQPHRDGERHIASDAAHLRKEARAGIAALERLLALPSCARVGDRSIGPR